MVSVPERIATLYGDRYVFVAKIDDSIYLESLNTTLLHYLYNKHKQ